MGNGPERVIGLEIISLSGLFPVSGKHNKMLKNTNLPYFM